MSAPPRLEPGKVRGISSRRIAVAALLAVGTSFVLSCGETAANGNSFVTAPGGSSPTLGSIIVAVSPKAVTAGQAATATATATASGLDQSGFPFALGPVAWSTGSATIASVSTNGVVTGLAAGQTTVIAASAGVQGQAPITVNAPSPVLTTIAVSLAPTTITQGQTSKASVTGLDQNGVPFPVGSVTWSSSLPAIASVNAIGVASGLAPGLAQIVATSGTLQSQAPLTVLAIPVASVTVTPATSSVAIGQTGQLTAKTLDASGNSLGRTVAWTSSDTTKATVSASGLVTGVALGAVTITATSEGKSFGATVTVTSGVLWVNVSPGLATIVAGRTLPITASISAVQGVNTALSYTSSNTAVATVAGAGLAATVTGVAAGTATITVTSVADSSKHASLSLTVDAYGLAVTVQPSTVVASAAIAPSVAVSIQNGAGVTVVTATNSITLAIGTNPGNGVLGGTTTVAAVAGVATFPGLTINATGTGYTLSATSAGLLTATSNAFNVTAGPPAKVAFAVQPGATFVNTNISPALVVLVEDALGNLETGSSAIVTLTIATNPSGATLGGTASVAAVGGVATFNNVTLDIAGVGYTLSAASAGLASATSNSFNISGPFAAIVAGLATNCGYMTYGIAYCWGDNTAGALGNNSGATQSNTPVKVSTVTNFDSLGAGSGYMCGSTSANTAYCWGSGASGSLGNGSNASSPIPVLVTGGLTFREVSGSCGVTTANAAWCWGDNGNGQLGNGTYTASNFPVLVSGAHVFSMVTGARPGHSCGIAALGVAYCWGNNSSGQLGNGSTTNSNVPVAVSGPLLFSQISVGGGGQTCGVTTAGSAYCWGANGNGLLGNGSLVSSTTPVPVAGGLTFAMVSAGISSNCGVTTGGVAYCWGNGSSGELGNGTTNTSSVPVAVFGSLTFARVSAGGTTNCGLTTAGTAYCWGDNSSGQLGTGSNASNSLVPVMVSTPP